MEADISKTIGMVITMAEVMAEVMEEVMAEVMEEERLRLRLRPARRAMEARADDKRKRIKKVNVLFFTGLQGEGGGIEGIIIIEIQSIKESLYTGDWGQQIRRLLKQIHIPNDSGFYTKNKKRNQRNQNNDFT
jgi:hypothetical protein